MKQEMKNIYDVCDSILRHGKKVRTIEIESRDTFYKLGDAQRASINNQSDRKLEAEASALSAEYNQHFTDMANEERAAREELEECVGERSRNALRNGMTIGSIVGAVGVGILWVFKTVIDNK